MTLRSSTGSRLDRSRPQCPGTAHPFVFPSFERVRLRNGMEVLCAPMPRFPLVSLDLLLPAGGRHARPDEPGLPSFHCSLLDEGTTSRSALKIATSAEQLGSYFGSSSDWSITSVGANLLRQHLDAGLALVADIGRRPSFPDEEVERLRRQRLAEILRRQSQPASLAQRFFSQTVFRGTVFAEPLIGTEESVSRFGRDDCLAFYERHVGPRDSVFLAVGDVELDNLVQSLERFFGDWQGDAADEPPPVEPETLEGVEVHLVDRPGSAQTQLRMGHLGVARNSPDHPKVVVMNALLGGIFTSRINLNLRERNAYTYGAHSQLLFRHGLGALAIGAAVATESAGAAIREILHEMNRMRDEKVGEEELRGCLDFVVGAFPITVQTIGDVTKRLQDLVAYGLADDTYQHYPENLRDVTSEEVQDTARRYLHPEKLAIVAVGPAEELRPQLEGLGKIEVHDP